MSQKANGLSMVYLGDGYADGCKSMLERIDGSAAPLWNVRIATVKSTRTPSNVSAVVERFLRASTY